MRRSLGIIACSILSGCGYFTPKADTVIADYLRNVERLGLIGIYPPREGVIPGDIWFSVSFESGADLHIPLRRGVDPKFYQSGTLAGLGTATATQDKATNVYDLTFPSIDFTNSRGAGINAPGIPAAISAEIAVRGTDLENISFSNIKYLELSDSIQDIFGQNMNQKRIHEFDDTTSSETSDHYSNIENFLKNRRTEVQSKVLSAGRELETCGLTLVTGVYYTNKINYSIRSTRQLQVAAAAAPLPEVLSKLTDEESGQYAVLKEKVSEAEAEAARVSEAYSNGALKDDGTPYKAEDVNAADAAAAEAHNSLRDFEKNARASYAAALGFSNQSTSNVSISSTSLPAYMAVAIDGYTRATDDVAHFGYNCENLFDPWVVPGVANTIPQSIAPSGS